MLLSMSNRTLEILDNTVLSTPPYWQSLSIGNHYLNRAHWFRLNSPFLMGPFLKFINVLDNF